MSYHIVIPARMASVRLPGKPLSMICGHPLIEHVYRRAAASEAAEVVIATDSVEIHAAATAFGAHAVMTSDSHTSGSDRIAEAADELGWADDVLIVNLQGDEPLMPPTLLDQVAGALGQCPDAAMSTLAVQLDDKQVFDSNAVKVVCDRDGMALYFSRAPIPWKRGRFESGSEDAQGMLRHLGIYAYRVGFLHRYVTWPPAPVEQQESLEQLRVLWNGERIVVDVAAQAPPPGVDSEEDYQRLLRHLG